MIENPLQQNNQRSWFLITTIIAFVVIAGFSIYLEISTFATRRSIETLTEKRKTLTEADGPAVVEGAMSLEDIKNLVQNIQNNQFVWSKIISLIEETVPKRAETQDYLVQLRSYNTSGDGTITVSALTQPISEDPFADIAEVINAFVHEPSFKDVFVPSITKNILLGANGNTAVLSFAMNFKYVKN